MGGKLSRNDHSNVDYHLRCKACIQAAPRDVTNVATHAQKWEAQVEGELPVVEHEGRKEEESAFR